MPQELTLDEIRVRLTKWLAGRSPNATDVHVSGFEKPSVGLSNETYSLEVTWKESGTRRQEKLIIRWGPPPLALYPKYDMKEQFLTFQCLATAGIPVPRPRWFEQDESVIGHPFFIVEHVEGWIPPENPPYHIAGPLVDSPPERRARIWRKTVEVLGRIHTLDWRRAGFAFLGAPGSGTDSVARHLAYFDKIMKSADPPTEPTLDRVRQWLGKSIPVAEHVSLCWGDARPTNIIWQGDEPAAVIDWETAMLADGEADLAWMIHMDWLLSEGYGIPRLEGLPDADETVAYYEQVTGRKVKNLFYHSVFSTWRHGVIFHKLEPILRARGYLPPDVPSINTPNLEKLKRLIEVEGRG
jgi:aminoglycoside phosphotransferase (APT) family kinase protein